LEEVTSLKILKFGEISVRLNYGWTKEKGGKGRQGFNLRKKRKKNKPPKDEHVWAKSKRPETKPHREAIRPKQKTLLKKRRF